MCEEPARAANAALYRQVSTADGGRVPPLPSLAKCVKRVCSTHSLHSLTPICFRFCACQVFCKVTAYALYLTVFSGSCIYTLNYKLLPSRWKSHILYGPQKGQRLRPTLSSQSVLQVRVMAHISNASTQENQVDTVAWTTEGSHFKRHSNLFSPLSYFLRYSEPLSPSTSYPTRGQ